MFGVRIICIESAIFTSYSHQHYNKNNLTWSGKTIGPVMPPELRLPIYLAPCFIPFIINFIRLFFTTKGLSAYFFKYPQFFIACSFTPFMFEGHNLNNENHHYSIKIWKWGTIINALYIGCLPQIFLCAIDYYRGVYSWEFVGNTLAKHYIYENNSALIKYRYGNLIFSLSTSTFFFCVIILFFGTQNMFGKLGFHCRCLTVMCCPCPNPCIHIVDPTLQSSILESMPLHRNRTNIQTQITVASKHDTNQNQEFQFHTEIFLYKKWGHGKLWLVGSPNVRMESILFEVLKLPI